MLGATNPGRKAAAGVWPCKLLSAKEEEAGDGVIALKSGISTGGQVGTDKIKITLQAGCSIALLSSCLPILSRSRKSL
jgi:hypothetical protein